MKHKLKRAYSLSARDWIMLAEAWLTLTWIDFAVSFLPYRWWKSWLLIQPDAKANQSSTPSLPFPQLVWSVNAAANHHLRKPTCLRRSLTLKRMLLRRHVTTDLRIGIRKNRNQVDAHAWIEQAGIVINDSPDIATRYSQFPVLKEELLRHL
jgi:hypothetical protein